MQRQEQAARPHLAACAYFTFDFGRVLRESRGKKTKKLTKGEAKGQGEHGIKCDRKTRNTQNT